MLVLGLGIFAGFAHADVNNSFWVKQANGQLYTNGGNGIGNSIINVAGCNGCSTGLNSVLVDNVTIFGDGLNVPLFAQSTSNNRIISGNASWSGTGYVYDISALTYWFDGVLLGPTAATQITLNASDPTNDRFDALVVDQAGVISKITGTASANPVFPAIPDSQLLIQYVNVGAGTTTPVILQDLIYNENTGPTAEWTATQFDTTTGAIGTVNVASTNAPKSGTVCIQATGVNARRGAKLVRQTAIDLQQFAYVQIWYRNDGVALPAAKVPYFQFQNSAGNPTGNNVNLLTYGISRTVVNTWQLAVVPVSAFGNLTTIKGARGLVIGGTTASTASFSLDYMLLSGGILPQGAIGPIYLSPSNTLYSTGAGTGATAVTDSIFFGNLSGFQATSASNSIFQGAGSGYKATGAFDSIFIGKNSGYLAYSANSSIFIGPNAGNGATSANYSTFIGDHAGYLSSSAYSSTFFGYQAGQNAVNANQSVFMGNYSGQNAFAADNSFFLGYRAGYGATNSSASAFLGSQAGDNAVNASGAVFLGYQAGLNAANSTGSVFIGQQTGSGATNTAPSIAIGAAATPGAFNNSIAIGTAATSTSDNQFTIGNVLFPINQVIINGTGGIQVPVGTTGERITTQGTIRYNTTTSKFEGYDGSTWVNLN